MKKVLCGLVIAVMMTGSGYANLDKDECSYLKQRSENYIFNAKISWDAAAEKLVKGRGSQNIHIDYY